MRVKLYLAPAQRKDFGMPRSFLQVYTGSLGPFNSYRQEVERRLQWAWHIAGKVPEDVKREDIEAFIHLMPTTAECVDRHQKTPQFMVTDGARQSSPEWRPFVATVSKSAFKKSQIPDKAEYALTAPGS